MTNHFSAAQQVLTQIKSYNPRQDTPQRSFFKFLLKKANKFTQSGILKEDERQIFEKRLRRTLA